jgi:hypothetical protein
VKINLFSQWCSQGCGNMEMLCLSMGKLSEKSYLPDKILLVLFLFKHSILANTVAGSWVRGRTFLKSTGIASWSVTEESVHNWNQSNLWSIVQLHKTSDIVLIKLTQVPLHKWSLPKWRPFMCAVSEWQDAFRYNISWVEKVNFGIGSTFCIWLSTLGSIHDFANKHSRQ